MIFLAFMKHAIDKVGKSLRHNEVKKFQKKVIAEVVSSQNFFAVLPKEFGLNVNDPYSVHFTEPSIVSE